MFNRQGVHGAAVYRMAEELSISPGNVTYYFRTKSELVAELAAAFAEQIKRAVDSMSVPLRPVEVVAHMDQALRILWHYRFLFNSALHISQIDAETAAQTRAIQVTLANMLNTSFEAAIARGEMRRPPQDDGVTLLCENILAVWLQWLRAESIDFPEKAELEPASLRQCMRRHLSLIDPYVGRQFSKVSWKAIDSRYPAD